MLVLPMSVFSISQHLSVTGVELYMLPAIDMINHATQPDMRNTLLRKSNAELTVKVDGEPMTIQGFFTMKAGQCRNVLRFLQPLCCHLYMTVYTYDAMSVM